MLTGMRAGELHGLHWKNVETGARRLELVVVIPKMLADALDEHRRGLVKAQHPGLSNGIIFPSQRGTPPPHR